MITFLSPRKTYFFIIVGEKLGENLANGMERELSLIIERSYYNISLSIHYNNTGNTKQMSNDDSNTIMKGLIDSTGKGYPTRKSGCFDKKFCERDLPPSRLRHTPPPTHRHQFATSPLLSVYCKIVRPGNRLGSETVQANIRCPQ